MIKILSCTFFLVIAIGIATAAPKPTVDEVASKLSCYCGTCPHLVVTQCGCGTADQIKRQIKKMIDSGMTQDQIIQSYVSTHGNTALAAPPKKGFSLTAWLLPFFSFAAGLVALTFFLKRQKEEVAAIETPIAQADDASREEFKKESEQFK